MRIGEKAVTAEMQKKLAENKGKTFGNYPQIFFSINQYFQKRKHREHCGFDAFCTLYAVKRFV